MVFKAVDALACDARVRGVVFPGDLVPPAETVVVKSLQKRESGGIRTELLSGWYHDDGVPLLDARSQGSKVCLRGPSCARCRPTGPSALHSATGYETTGSDADVLPATRSGAANRCVTSSRGYCIFVSCREHWLLSLVLVLRAVLKWLSLI